jgi:phosphoribosylformylglycinamidine cyclo-ligase
MLSKKIPIKGMAHITGGGLLENIPRILPKHCAVEIRKSACPVLPVFSKLCQLGQLDDHEAYRTFNMGVGLVMIISPDALSSMRGALTAFSEFPLYEIGVVTSGEQQVRLV